MRYVLGFVCVLALGLMGCSETADAGPIKSGLWLGGDPASNTNGEPFDTGWAICFFVNEEGTALTPSTECDIDGNDDEAYSLEISWKNDVGGDEDGEPCNTDDWAAWWGDEFGITANVPIEDGSFFINMGQGGNIEGTLDGDTATGTAGVQFHTGLNFGWCALALDGGWTASPVME